MRLRRLEIRRFRKLSGPVVLDGLGDGLTVVGGDNEEGKSTVLAALKAALFEPHTVGGAVRDLMTPHDGGVPEVLVEMEIGGGRYRLHKAFRRGGVTLDTPQGRLTGDAAEQALIDLLRFERRTAHRAKPQNHGLQAVFWVDQGSSFGGFEALEAGRDRFSAAVEAEAGAVVAGDRARRLLNAVTRRAREHWTATGKETGALAEAGARVQALAAARDELRARRQAHDAAIDRLARLRDERRRAIESDELGRARLELAAARKAVATVEELEAELERLGGEVRLCEAQWRRLDEQARRRRDLVLQLGAAASAAASAERDLAARRDEAGLAEAVARRADAAEAEAGRRSAELDRMHELAGGQRRMVELSRHLARLRDDHAAAGEAGATVQRLEASLAVDPATSERVAAAVEAQSAWREATAALQAAATRLDFAPLADAAIVVAGEPHPAGEALHIAVPTEIELEGFGRVTVQPGGSDLDRREAALRKAAAALRSALSAAGAADVADARRMLGARQRTERELVDAEARLRAVLAGHGRIPLAELSGRLARAEAELAGLSSRFPPADDPDGLDGAIELLEAQRRAAREARDRAGQERQHATGVAGDARAEVARGEARSIELAERLAALHRAMAEEVDRCPDERLASELATAEEAKAAAEQRASLTARRLAGSDPALVRDRLAQAGRKVATIEADGQALDRRIRDVEIELRSSEAQAIGERLDEVEGELARAVAERQRLARVAAAWKLLHDELAAAIASARDALLVPVRERIGPYLQRLFPGAEAIVEAETLALGRLRRDGVDERFEQLSLGTREQLAIVVRLALARLLQEKEGEAPCLVLDDALVYADEARLEVMKTILQQAARDLQILILTCRPRDYRGLEARFLRLEDCRG
ncbi:MAG TPA: AAA family ATPase [Geminicoccaceae bacterium]|nr:AAA family ATPase [Geminicoccus sp.]HMU50498.1 AAA family ATPase [Geminicoccaceae bacterium]